MCFDAALIKNTIEKGWFKKRYGPDLRDLPLNSLSQKLAQPTAYNSTVTVYLWLREKNIQTKGAYSSIGPLLYLGFGYSVIVPQLQRPCQYLGNKGENIISTLVLLFNSKYMFLKPACNLNIC